MLINFAWAFPQLESFGVVCFVKCFDSRESCFKRGKSEKQRKGKIFKWALLTRKCLPLSASVPSPTKASSTIRENFNGLFLTLKHSTRSRPPQLWEPALNLPGNTGACVCARACASEHCVKYKVWPALGQLNRTQRKRNTELEFLGQFRLI